MTNNIKRTSFYCKDKERDVVLEYTESGNWFSPHRKLISCPAIQDGGSTCTHRCMKELDLPLSVRRNK